MADLRDGERFHIVAVPAASLNTTIPMEYELTKF